jgi:TRAP-type mannitol/chloroaromatic compound transport system permease small subunit
LKIANRFNDLVAIITATCLLLMMANVFLDVILRYFFSSSSIALQEMEWHLFSVMFLIGISYALNDEAHVRVDFIYDNFTIKTKAMINIIGTLIFLIPFAFLIAYGSYNFVYDAYIYNEISEDPGGLTHRWIIKSMIPLSFILLLLASINYIYKNIQILKTYKKVSNE